MSAPLDVAAVRVCLVAAQHGSRWHQQRLVEEDVPRLLAEYEVAWHESRQHAQEMGRLRVALAWCARLPHLGAEARRALEGE